MGRGRPLLMKCLRKMTSLAERDAEQALLEAASAAQKAAQEAEKAAREAARADSAGENAERFRGELASLAADTEARTAELGAAIKKAQGTLLGQKARGWNRHLLAGAFSGWSHAVESLAKEELVAQSEHRTAESLEQERRRLARQYEEENKAALLREERLMQLMEPSGNGETDSKRVWALRLSVKSAWIPSNRDRSDSFTRRASVAVADLFSNKSGTVDMMIGSQKLSSRAKPLKKVTLTGDAGEEEGWQIEWGEVFTSRFAEAPRKLLVSLIDKSSGKVYGSGSQKMTPVWLEAKGAEAPADPQSLQQQSSSAGMGRHVTGTEVPVGLVCKDGNFFGEIKLELSATIESMRPGEKAYRRCVPRESSPRHLAGWPLDRLASGHLTTERSPTGPATSTQARRGRRLPRVGQQARGAQPGRVLFTESGESADRLLAEPACLTERGRGDGGRGSQGPGAHPREGCAQAVVWTCTATPGRRERSLRVRECGSLYAGGARQALWRGQRGTRERRTGRGCR